MRVPVDCVESYTDICELHLCEFTTEAEALAEAGGINEETGENWTPESVDLADLMPEDLVEHFDG